jgi:hypothetical protein
MPLNPDDVLAAYDAQIRRDTRPPLPTWRVEDLGRIIRATAPEGGHTGAFIGWSDLGDLDGDEVDAVIAEQVAYFIELGRHSEWKYYDYDAPSDLSERLVAAGLHRDEDEALVVGETAAVLEACRAAGPIDGVRVRIADVPADLPAIAELHQIVWGEDWSWLADELQQEKSADPDSIEIYVAEDEEAGALMSSAWVRFQAGTDFAGLWGGSTHPDWRRRGAYRALVGVRGELAAARGVRYLQVDSAPDSQPILRRLGLITLAITTPHVWKPTSDDS